MLELRTNKFSVVITGDMGNFVASLSSFQEDENLEFVRLKLVSEKPSIPSPIMITWTQSTCDIQAQWNSALGYNRGLLPDWAGGWKFKSTSGAPVHCLYNYNGYNRLTFALSDALNPLDIKCGVNEETAVFMCSAELFIEPMPPITEYEVILRLDTRDVPYYESLKAVSDWWVSFEGFAPAVVPETARLPMYSTWYSFHQMLNTEKIINQCNLAKELGCETLIVDDGWQTEDNSRGYTYCGDWEVAIKKIPDMKKFVDDIHNVGMKIMIWYSVPFIGRYSKAWSKFKGKYLDSQNSNFCVLDPRFPEVREYIIDLYKKAVSDWNLDGLKLDFVDTFNITEYSKDFLGNGRDYDSVPSAVDRLLKDALNKLKVIKPDFMIEFRQSYIGPLMRSYGNMFRAADCPNDSLGNRLRILDIRLLCGNTATHSDMIMWNYEEPVESAAMQIINILFSVPQISVMVNKLPERHFKMIKYWLKFWRDNIDVLLDGKLMPLHPEANYSTVLASNSKKIIAVAYSSPVIKLPEIPFEEIILVNGSSEKQLLLQTEQEYKSTRCEVYNCCGELINIVNINLIKGVNVLDIPVAGSITLKANSNRLRKGDVDD